MMKQIRNILVATDFSAASRPAFRYAVAMAAGNRARLWIGHVLPSVPESIGGNPLPRMYREMDLFIQKDARQGLRALKGEAGRAGVRAGTLVLRGVAHDAIGRACRARRADLVVLGTHGRTGMARLLMGSVAARVLVTAPCPVLTVRMGGGRGERRGRSGVSQILFATDFSPASASAWRASLALAKSWGARLQIVHVVRPLAEAQGARWAYAEAEAEIRSDAGRRLQALQRRAEAAGVRADTLLARGAPQVALARAARSMTNGWIVLGTHGRTGLPGALLGSVAARVVATAPCPVLTVRGRGRA